MADRRKRRASRRPAVTDPDYRLIFRQAPIPAYIADAESTRILDVNQAALARYGYSRAEFLRLSAREIRPPEDAARYDAFIAEQAPRRDAFMAAGTWRHRTRAGEVFDVEVSWARVQWKGRPAYVAFVHDLSAQRSAEAALRRWAAVFRAVSEAVFISDRDGTLVDVNRSAEILLGRTRDALIGSQIGDWHASGATSSDDIRSIAAAKGLWHGQLTFFRPDGSIRITDTSVVQLSSPEGERTGFVGVNRDVTDTLAEMKAHLATAERLAAVFATAPFGMYILDPDLKVVDWNPAAERIFGWSAAETIGRVLPTLGTAGLDEGRELMALAKRGEPIAGVEVIRLRKDGTPITIQLSSASLRDASGTFTGLAAMVRDVTERKLLESQLLQAQRMESVGRLSGGIAHDFNNLLTAILGSAELLCETLAAGSPEREEVAEIEKASRRAAELTHQLLAFSRQQMLTPDVLDINSVVTDLTRMLGRVLGEDIHFETRLAPNLGKVRADPGQLGQVIMNLVVNARDAMPEGGMLTIATTAASIDEAYSATHSNAVAGEYIVVTVTDSGSGIPPDVLPHIFDPFYTTKAPGAGTGLGLSTAYGIVKQSGGYIWAYSEVGKGTTFKVYLPRWAGGDAPRAPRKTPVPADLRGRETILVVEDEPGIRRLLERTLAANGYKVIAATDALDAVTRLAQLKVSLDLLATDVVMPGMGGRELADQVRATHPGTKILFLSGYTEDAIIRQGIYPLANAFLEKPFTPADLLRKVRAVLDDVEVRSKK
ncbi:MAG TPA: PAS domain S-box protein [Gemmatimonadales bacterium]|nr:PAS domain S-box protein [Gemmatimonadales bacterium]